MAEKKKIYFVIYKDLKGINRKWSCKAKNEIDAENSFANFMHPSNKIVSSFVSNTPHHYE